MTLRVGSLFAGIGGFDLGFERAGFEVAWCAEWDRAAQAVLRTRFPRATVYGDIREIDLDALAPVDVVCGGFPCQDLSVAGKRAGLAGARSGLFHDAMRIVRRLRPSVLILENVPGLLSSNHGLDFATVLREVGEGWDCAEVGWRVLDSQYFGVAQRRRRVFVVGGSRIGCAQSILALAESCGGDPPSRGATREEAAADARGGAPVGGTWPSFIAPAVMHAFTGTSHAQYAEGVGTLRANGGDLGGGSETLAVCATGTISHTLTNASSKGETEDGTGRGTPVVAFHPTQDPISSTDGSTHALGCGSRQGCATVAVAQGVDLYNGAETGQVAATLTIASGGAGGSGPTVRTAMTVRRLTPTECERLQGFPDGWTQIGTDKPTADSHRYKQLGNAVTVNVAEWIARRVAAWLTK